MFGFTGRCLIYTGRCRFKTGCFLVREIRDNGFLWKAFSSRVHNDQITGYHSDVKARCGSDCLPNTYRFLRCKSVLTHFSLRETTCGTLYYVVHPAGKSAIAKVDLRFTGGNLRTKPSPAPQQVNYFTFSACHSSFNPPRAIQINHSNRRELRTIERGWQRIEELSS